MIGQYLPNNNENATVPILQKILHLNRAIVALWSSFMKAKERVYLHHSQNMQTHLFSCVRHMIIFS
jgi:hypothetical protein